MGTEVEGVLVPGRVRSKGLPLRVCFEQGGPSGVKHAQPFTAIAILLGRRSENRIVFGRRKIEVLCYSCATRAKGTLDTALSGGIVRFDLTRVRKVSSRGFGGLRERALRAAGLMQYGAVSHRVISLQKPF